MCTDKLKTICVFIIIFIFSSVKAGIIETSGDVCLGNLTYFKVKGINGINSINWDFGDGFTSKSTAPFHLYKSSGKFTVKVEIIQSNSNKISDFIQIEVHELPVAILKRSLFDSCLFTNLFEFKDESLPSNSSNPIVKRLMVWGDGDYELNQNRQYGDQVQHHYKMKDRYKIKMEVTDDKGCKGSAITNVVLVNGTLAKIDYEITYPNCGETQVCFKSNSQTSNGSNQTYIWSFDGGTAQILAENAVTCISTKKSKYATATLQLSNPDNTCLTTDTVKVYLDADSIGKGFSQNGTQFCYGSGSPVSISINSGSSYQFEWWLDNIKIDNDQNALVGMPKELGTLPGVHYVKCTVSKGPCSVSYNSSFTVTGPVARMRIFNQFQCGIDDRVFFIDTSLNLNKKSALYYWTVEDQNGQNCEIFRAINQNKHKNCNRSRDWFGKHDYTVPRASNKITLKVIDQSVGCSDSTIDKMEHFHCKLCNRDGGPIDICQGDTFLPLKDKEEGPLSFSLDTGRTWMKFPSQINKPYKGVYGVLFAFEIKLPDWAEDFGDDSILVHRYDTSWMDTIFAPDFLNVKETMDTAIWLDVENKCQPFAVNLHFKNPSFRAGDKVEIVWKDGNVSTLDLDKDSIIKYISHIYRIPGLDTTLTLRFTSYQGCTRVHSYPLRFGKILRLKRTGLPCLNTEICYETKVINALKLSTYNALVKQTWYSEKDTTIGTVTGRFCINFNVHGYKNIKVITIDSLGCSDTLTDRLPIRELKAGIVSDSRISYCSELKQMFDSSFHVFKAAGDYIKSYYWDFGSGMYTTYEKDPFRSFDLDDSIINTYHFVEDNNGCRDSIEFDLKVIGSRPQFEMTDTIGCAPLKVKFKNLSTRCSSYIWEFDDPDNITLEDLVKRNQDFIYDKEGKYYPKLIGIDTFYNPYTGAVYYCHETFDPKMAVTVFDTKYARMTSPDTICLGEEVSFDCDANVSNVNWNFGDGDKFPMYYEPVKKHTYTKTGTYKVEYSPNYTFANGQKYCKDSTIKLITVLGVKADFEIKSESQAPIFKFKNLSTPGYANLLWDFGDQGSNSNTSSAQEPEHNYGMNTGWHTICLTASVFNKCQDSICKPVNNDYVQSMMLYNVFTPGVIDSLNDEYDIQIKGEASYNLVIYDRWGVVVYTGTVDGEIGDGTNWNGTFKNNGYDCPSGTYYYVFNYSYLIAPKTFYTVNGTVTLLR